MELNQLKPAKGSVKGKKRVGRGEASGQGKTSGRGHKGQKARAGGFHKTGFEGGQMPLQRRLPKRGFTPLVCREYAVVNVNELERFEANTELDEKSLREAGLIKRVRYGLKILGNGEVSKPLIVKATCFSASAKQKIEKAGGKAIEI